MKLSFQLPRSGTVFSWLVALLGAGIALYPANPAVSTLPSRDSGVFLYAGWRMLNGGVPYLSVWDHKPPLIYFVDALGLLRGGNSLWGVWILQLIFISASIYLIHRALQEAFGDMAALAGAAILTSGLLSVLEQGNVTEEYALVSQAACFALLARAGRARYPLRVTFLMGLAAGLAFNFKQTTIGVWIAYGILLLIMRAAEGKLSSLVKDYAYLLGGWLIPTVALAGFLAIRHALGDFWDQAYLYNFTYVSKDVGLAHFVPVFIKGFAFLQQGWVLYFSVLGWLAGLGYAWLNRRDFIQTAPPLLLLALLAFPIEIGLLFVSGRSILHYYLTPLPVMAALSGLLIFAVPALAARLPASVARFQRPLAGAMLAAVLLAQIPQAQAYPRFLRELGANPDAAVIEYIRQHSTEGDTVLILGAESAVNFLAQRPAPTRYVYQYPLYLLARRPMVEEFFADILRNKPALIIDTRGQWGEKLYPSMQRRSEAVRAAVDYLSRTYRPVATFGEWVVYQYAPAP
jgi:4-amino-4-deoxy-L-arabinose transferase-like glycosyltransferase